MLPARAKQRRTGKGKPPCRRPADLENVANRNVQEHVYYEVAGARVFFAPSSAPRSNEGSAGIN